MKPKITDLRGEAMRTLLITVLSLFCLSLLATERGLTVSEIPCSDVVSHIQSPVSEFIPVPSIPANPLPEREDWNPVLNLDLDFRLNAWQQYGLQFDNIQSTAIPFGSLGVLSMEGKQAVNKAPTWLQAELSSVLASLQPEKQTLWANLIINTQDPYVDEIAFSIANSSPQYLNSAFALPELFTENVSFIYSIDSQLAYVEIVNTGSAAIGGNYYSTTRYYKKDANGQIQQITVPKELYYWYIVHPKLTDEIAAYIDPAIIENNSNHYNNIAAPPIGKFWRTYLFNLSETGYPVLADTLTECQTLFNRDGTGNDAIRTIQGWINQNMSFNSNNERPHQPVRIITKRMGRCGEYADLTSAVARLALIPCTSILSVSTDHTWNEFWDEGWVAWEPVNGYINDPLVYENGWGKVFGSVFEIRSDGLFTPVTDRYSEGHATIQIQVADLSMQPVDGARVVLAILDGSNRYDCEQFTDNNGFATFSVGENRNYRARVETTFGLFPSIAGTYTQLVENAENGQSYQYILVIPAVRPQPNLEVISPPPDPIDDHRFAVSFECFGYYVSSLTLWDDIYSLGSQPYHYKFVNQPSNAAFIVMDADNVLFWQLDGLGSAVGYVAPSMGSSSSFSIPVGQDWFAFMDNSHHHRNAIKLSGAMVYESYGSAVEDDTEVPPAFRLLNAYPNPFSGNMRIYLALPKAAELKVSIYNLKGQVVKSWQPSSYPSGQSYLAWDATGDDGGKVASGIYIWKVTNGKEMQSCKVAVIK